MKRNKIYLMLILLVAGCSGSYKSSTNLDIKNFTDYFSPSGVKIYSSEKEFAHYYKYIGLVEGESCQVKAHHAKPDEIIARTDARRKAVKLNANAIIFTGCTLVTGEAATKQCIAASVCFGQAYFVQTKG